MLIWASLPQNKYYDGDGYIYRNCKLRYSSMANNFIVANKADDSI